MAMTPIGARCRRCDQGFYLFEVRDQGTGACPRCGRLLAPEWTAILLEDIARAEIAQRHLVQALRRLRGLPGNLAVRPHTVLRNFFKEIGWQDDLADDPATLREELRRIRQHVTAWQQFDRTVAATRPRRSWLQRLIQAIAGRRLDAAAS
ncbi:MAG TPA: hypothetical protein VKB57_23480 [Acidimicrobiales bacterium]|nr:hypothetical protein [Acidimicrobiales bacterium]